MNWLLVDIAGMMLSAATERDNVTRDLLIEQVHNYAASSQNSTTFDAYYNPTTGLANNHEYNAAGVNS